jgi:hypothetical protein
MCCQKQTPSSGKRIFVLRLRGAAARPTAPAQIAGGVEGCGRFLLFRLLRRKLLKAFLRLALADPGCTSAMPACGLPPVPGPTAAAVAAAHVSTLLIWLLGAPRC